MESTESLKDRQAYLLLRQAMAPSNHMTADIARFSATIYSLTQSLGDEKVKSLSAEGVTKEGLYAQRDELLERLEALLMRTLEVSQFKLTNEVGRVLSEVRTELGGSAGLSPSEGPLLCLSHSPSASGLRVIEGTFREHVCSVFLLLYMCASSCF